MTNNNKFYSLNNDIIFKNNFDTEKSLKRLLEKSLNLKVNKIFSNNIELPVENIKERRKYLDLILDSNKGIINVEVNHVFKDEIPNRNFLYFCKLISSTVKKLNQNQEILDVIIENEDEIIRNTLYEKSISKSIEQNKIEVAKNLLKMKMDLKDISKATGLSFEKIEKLKK